MLCVIIIPDVFSRRYTNGLGSSTNNEASVSPNALKYSYRVYEFDTSNLIQNRTKLI